jgi:hypothetical protein
VLRDAVRLNRIPPRDAAPIEEVPVSAKGVQPLGCDIGVLRVSGEVDGTLELVSGIRKHGECRHEPTRLRIQPDLAAEAGPIAILVKQESLE